MTGKRIAILVDRVTGAKIPVTSSSSKPGSIRRPVWVDDEGNALMEVNGAENDRYEVTHDSAATRIRIGRELAVLRADRGLSLRQAAAETGIDASNLTRIEKGQTAPTIDLLGRLCDCYRATVTIKKNR